MNEGCQTAKYNKGDYFILLEQSNLYYRPILSLNLDIRIIYLSKDMLNRPKL